MRARIKKGIAGATALLATTAAVAFGLSGNGWAQSSGAQSSGLRAFGITADGTLMATFTTDRPQQLDWVLAVTGLSGDRSLVGIDIRVQDGLMYGLGNQGGIYTIKTPPVTSDVVLSKVSQLSVPLYGTAFDIDFNPAADRLRVISDTGQNLRHNLADGSTVEDAVLTTPPPPGPTKGVTAAAYTNNDLNADTATTLFDINTVSDQVVIQAPANNGTVSPTGALGVNAGLNAGLDIFSDVSDGKTTSVSAFATLVAPSGSASLYTINLFTGAATSVGQFPLPITDLTLALDTI